MVFREILLAVGDTVQKVDGNGLIDALVLSHAEQLVFMATSTNPPAHTRMGSQ